ncbi:hypothetical protein AURDEDRAFT_131191 [Auricularia subglabra TFB-10046 SS5]|uniref:F-box domain-containing protein n=1 Tax=Auricularia subglabra (strain TFB-10046 / SS5) TaxID=717982 RepID=J0WR60_AURST|nr:hypothetical protein AURDEDRAFT_131191 [Auricularia subglabra TFB-10046 SS5]
MLIRYRTFAPQPPNGNSAHPPVTWHQEYIDETDFPCESVLVAGVIGPPPLAAVSAMEIHLIDLHEDLRVPTLLYVLQFMPYLQDLTIDVNAVVLAPRGAPAPPLPFCLRRLVLSPVFPGAANLLSCSSDTLECLVLGNVADDVRYSDALENIPFSRFTRLSALRMLLRPDPMILSACVQLRSLALATWSGETLQLMQQRCVRRPLARLSLIHSLFDSDAAMDVARAVAGLPVLAALRTLEIELDEGNDDFALAGCAGKQALADVCRARRISVSVIRTRLPGAWEK